MCKYIISSIEQEWDVQDFKDPDFCGLYMEYCMCLEIIYAVRQLGKLQASLLTLIRVKSIAASNH